MLNLFGYVLVCAVGMVASMSINGQHDLGSPLRVAQCRAHCLGKFVKQGKLDDTCLQDPDCFMCWENCAVLQDSFPFWSMMCNQPRLCFPGCQEACAFHRNNPLDAAQKDPVIPTMGEPAIKLTGDLAEWPKKDKKKIVYVLIQKESPDIWHQLAQTTEERFILPPKSSHNLRILVVGREGFLGYYRPEEKELRGATVLSRPNHWSLKEVSLIHQRVLVIAEVAWPAQRTGEKRVKNIENEEDADYLVTWEVDGGGLKGHLYTDATSVTLSLWPETVYHIQVELVNSLVNQQERSESLTIDTRKAPLVTSDERVAPAAPLVNKLESTEDGSRVEAMVVLVTVVGICLIIFMIFAATFLRRRKLQSKSEMGSSSDLRSDFDSTESKYCPEIVCARTLLPIVVPALPTALSSPNSDNLPKT
ncbi:uncharacterized protein LOC136029316 [Artemia franciscana]|uniref:Uncharacterized protein n=1 Tax=Artemia franciscana TaxID=6661 RepID=A0AA88H8U0_ARTSF|nr:hypothetical protein QYM36_015264 [Artemia franciscana]